MAQTWNDLALWEAFLSRHRVGSIIELGTWEGGMSLYLAHQCKYRGGQFVSVDWDLSRVIPRVEIEAAGGRLLALDLHSPGASETLRDLLAELRTPRLLFCDHGNKRLEWKSYVPLLSAGDYAVVRDWGSEFGVPDLDPHLPYVMREECESVGSLTRFFSVPTGETLSDPAWRPAPNDRAADFVREFAQLARPGRPPGVRPRREQPVLRPAVLGIETDPANPDG
jgi:hypothetical protein